MLRCCITDRVASFEGADWVQVRNKDLAARELMELVRGVMANRLKAKVLVNTRVDIALAAGADGAHLPAGSIAPRLWRAITPEGFLIGVSCHTFDESVRAEQDGADYVLFGPVFAPLSKSSDLPPRGLEELSRVSRAVSIPVLALGGITEDNAEACVSAGAAGVAGITLFRS